MRSRGEAGRSVAFRAAIPARSGRRRIALFDGIAVELHLAPLNIRHWRWEGVSGGPRTAAGLVRNLSVLGRGEAGTVVVDAPWTPVSTQ